MALSVRFYQRPVLNEFQTDLQGRPIHDMRDFVRIEIPGIVANVVDTFAGEHHKRDHPIQWAQYLNEKATGQFTEHQGTLLSDWPQLSAIQVLEMKHLKFYTVEQVAEASDSQINAIGMLAGMSPMSLRDKAKAWLAKASGSAAVDELAKRDEKIAALQAQMTELMGKPTDAPTKAGRSKKETADA